MFSVLDARDGQTGISETPFLGSGDPKWDISNENSKSIFGTITIISLHTIVYIGESKITLTFKFCSTYIF